VKKADLIEKMAEAADLTKAEAGRALDAFVKSVTESLRDGDEVVLVGFGSFKLRTRPARQGRNPKTGEPIQIEAAKLPVFQAGKALKDAVK
jgi:DNA-binding protein HU-beta